MRVLILRHGSTPLNLRRAYVGRRCDEGLSDQGLAEARSCAGLVSERLASLGLEMPKRVFVSPLSRARQTARLVFPQSEQACVEGLAEMDFGLFEGKTADEMADDASYRQWVDGMCEGPCPEGEGRQEFAQRSCEAFCACVAYAREAGEELAAVVAHGGTLMAVMERYATPSKDYFSWHVHPCGGYLCDLCWEEGDALRLMGVQVI